MAIKTEIEKDRELSSSKAPMCLPRYYFTGAQGKFWLDDLCATTNDFVGRGPLP